jgi:hypothetical protein
LRASAQEPPLVVVPPLVPPGACDTPDEGAIPDEEDEDDEPVDDDPAGPDEPSNEICGNAAVMFANLAPMTAAAAAESSPTRQVTFLTRRSPSSRARTDAA